MTIGAGQTPQCAPQLLVPVQHPHHISITVNRTRRSGRTQTKYKASMQYKIKQESPAIADKPARRESLLKLL